MCDRRANGAGRLCWLGVVSARLLSQPVTVCSVLVALTALTRVWSLFWKSLNKKSCKCFASTAPSRLTPRRITWRANLMWQKFTLFVYSPPKIKINIKWKQSASECMFIFFIIFILVSIKSSFLNAAVCFYQFIWTVMKNDANYFAMFGFNFVGNMCSWRQRQFKKHIQW